jgi:hypothetical protein
MTPSTVLASLSAIVALATGCGGKAQSTGPGAGSSCVRGGCQPAPLATGQAGASWIAADSSNVYWAIQHVTGQSPDGSIDAAVVQCAASGCTTPTTLAAWTTSGGLGVESMAADANNVYWATNDGKVLECAVGGCNGSPTQLASGQAATAMVADGHALFWVGGSSGEPGAVMMCEAAGCNGSPTVVASVQNVPMGIAVDETNVYWVNQGDGTVMKCAIAGCNDRPTTLASGQDHPWGIATDGSSAYWTNYGTHTAPKTPGTVMLCAVGGCDQKPTLLASGFSGPTAIVVHGGGVYWSDGLAGAVYGCPVGGCNGQPATLASGFDATPDALGGCLAVNDSNLFWTAGAGGTIFELGL